MVLIFNIIIGFGAYNLSRKLCMWVCSILA